MLHSLHELSAYFYKLNRFCFLHWLLTEAVPSGDMVGDPLPLGFQRLKAFFTKSKWDHQHADCGLGNLLFFFFCHFTDNFSWLEYCITFSVWCGVIVSASHLRAGILRFFCVWTIFKVFTEFVTILLLFSVLVYWLWGMWDFSFPTRKEHCTPCIGRWGLNPGPPGTSLGFLISV